MSEREFAAERGTRRRRGDGERSRSAILGAAARLATVEGMDGLSIARLADAVGMSKSGLFAHFGSKEELQLATIDAALASFQAEVLTPAFTNTPPGRQRLLALCDGFLSYVERRVWFASESMTQIRVLISPHLRGFRPLSGRGPR